MATVRMILVLRAALCPYARRLDGIAMSVEVRAARIGCMAGLTGHLYHLGYQGPLPQLPTVKPLPDLSPENPSSDHSSIAPSQSASQIGPTAMMTSSSMRYTLTIAPAHSISEHAMPNGTAYLPQPARVAEEPGGSSAEEGEQNQDLRVVENERFLPSRKRRGQGPVRAHVRTVSEAAPNRHVHFPASTSDTFLLRSPTEKDVEKKRSIRRAPQAVFGSIAALFRGHKNAESADESSPVSPTAGRWKTRTDRNVKRSARGADSSDEEDLKLRQAFGPSISAPVMQDAPQAGPGPATQRARKLKRGSVQVPPRTTPKEQDDRGWVSEGEHETVKGRKGKGGTTNVNESDAEPPSPNSPNQAAPSQPDYGQLSRSNSLKKPRPRRAPDGSLNLVSSTPAEAPLSRNSSMSKQSVMSAPPAGRHNSISITNVTPPVNPASRRRTTSLDQSPNPPSRSPSSRTTTKRAAEPNMNLMSIVEDVRKNRDMFAHQQDPNRLLILPKAPPPVSQLLEWEEEKERDAKQVEENLRSIAAAAEASAFIPPEPPTPTTATTVASLPTERDEHPVKPVIHSPPDKAHQIKPLRSTLRNPSRSPSPAQSPPLQPVAGSSKLKPLVLNPSPPHPNGSAVPTGGAPGGDEDDDDDDASISSYETGHEAFNDDDDNNGEFSSPAASFPSPPAPPPHDAPKTNGNAMNSDLSQSTDSTTDANGAPKRQKSVRMSLPPTFSKTPPAIHEEYDEDGDVIQAVRSSGRRERESWSHSGSGKQRRSRHIPPAQDPEIVMPNGGAHTTRSGGWQSHIPEHPTYHEVWADSSDEDEEYGKAKRMLSKLTRKG